MPAINQSVQDRTPITVPAMAEILDVSTRKVERLIAAGALKTVEPPRRGRAVRITAASARAYLEGEAAS